ncbi:MAG: LLM class F420-dependent oxidoreductase, partial [Nocardioides sp.]|nr:LLM class F420-dependent oxidoreductase [Nocardioides sp.]
ASGGQVAERIGWVRAAAGERPVELNVNLMAVGDVVPGHLRGRFDPSAAQGSAAVLTGSTAEMAEQLLERRDRLGISYVLVGDELMDAFLPVMGALGSEC